MLTQWLLAVEQYGLCLLCDVRAMLRCLSQLQHRSTRCITNFSLIEDMGGR